MSASGHVSTIGGLIRRTLFPTPPPTSSAWSTTIDVPGAGQITLHGRLSCPQSARDLVILIHGLGGSSESGYMTAAARAAQDLGIASLRLSLRGADGRSGDFYHGGLTDDLHAVVAALPSSDFERVFVLGFSLGGHVTLRFATEVEDARVGAVAALCSPLDLAVGANAMDRTHMAPYRAYVLRRLKKNYRKTAALGRVPTSAEALSHVRTIREWDSLTVVPRFGFESPDDYYARASAGPHLSRLRRPAFLLATEDDPMIPPGAIRASLGTLEDSPSTHSYLTIRWLKRGGHLGFPRHLDLGLQGPPGVESQVLLWLQQAAGEAIPHRRENEPGTV